MTAPAYPLFLLLEGKRVLVVGGGPVALEKARELAAHGARVRVVAPDVRDELVTLADELYVRSFEPSDVDGAFLVVAAATPEVNRAVRAEADRRPVFIVAVDDVASCTAYGAARFQRAGLTVAISSSGTAPALVALLRRAIEAVIPEDVERWHEVAASVRATTRAAGTPFVERRPLLLRALLTLYPNVSANEEARS